MTRYKVGEGEIFSSGNAVSMCCVGVCGGVALHSGALSRCQVRGAKEVGQCSNWSAFLNHLDHFSTFTCRFGIVWSLEESEEI